MLETTAHPHRIGLALVVGGTAMMATTVWLLPATTADRSQTCVIAAAMAAAAVGWRGVLVATRHPRGLIGYPLIIFTGLAALGSLTTGIATSYSGLFTLAFIYLGLWGPPRSTLRLVLPATLCWLCNNGVLLGAPLRTLEVRLPMAVVIWITIGQLLSQHSLATMRAAATLRREALRDPLTGLRNRRVLEELLSTAEPGDAIALLDIDHFKAVNDERGHAAGDQVLAAFARVIARSIRDQDLAVRFGGDEFLIFLPNTSLAQADAVVQRVHDSWAASEPAPTFSAGIASVRTGRDGTDAFGEADRFLYEAKSAGRNQTARPATICLPAQRTAAPDQVVERSRHGTSHSS